MALPTKKQETAFKLGLLSPYSAYHNKTVLIVPKQLLQTMVIKQYFLLAVVLIVASACSTPKEIRYFQDLENGSAREIASISEIQVKVADKISIVVNSKDPLLANMFNLPVVAHRVGESSSLSQSQQVSSYTVDRGGNIDFPVLGKVHVAGMKREEVAETIKSQLISRQLVNDPVVTVEWANLYFSVLGEVNKPGRYTIDRDKVSLLDAIGMAGDLTIFGQRKSVMVMREENGQQSIYKVDLTSADQLFASPVYYLQQKDVIYIEPNDTRARQSTVNGNNVRSTSFWISLSSLLTTIAVLVFK